MKVVDRWYSNPDLAGTEKYWGIGTIKEILKTRIKIKFQHCGIVSFDYPHFRSFIEPKNHFNSKS